MKALLALTAAVLGAAALAIPALANHGAVGNARPDDRAGRASLAQVRPDDRAGVRGTDVVNAGIATTVVVPATRGGFDWGDAGIGAGAGAGLVLLLFGASLLVRHARTEPRPA